MIQQYPLNITISNNKVHQFIPVNDFEIEERVLGSAPYFYVDGYNSEYKTIFGNPVDRYEYEAYHLRDSVIQMLDVPVYESDITPARRFLVDNYYNHQSTKLYKARTGFIDIEVDCRGGFPDVNKGDRPITMFSVYDNMLDKIITLGLYPKKGMNVDLPDCIFFNNESDLLINIIKLFQRCKWQIITGWNSEDFDMPMIMNRCINVLGEESIKSMSPVHCVRKDHKGHWNIAGVSHLDYLHLYKKFEAGLRESYKLDYILRTEIGEGKVEFEGSLDELYTNNFEKFVEYNRQDVAGLRKLDSKKKFIDLTRQLTSMACCELEDIYYNTRLVDGLILSKLKSNNLVAPDKPVKDDDSSEDESPFEGAFVYEPEKGLHEWVVSLDLTSLYPSIIRTLNMSPETIRGEADIFNTEGYLISSNGYKFTKEFRGVIPLVTDELFNKRLEYKELKEEAIKNKDEELEDFYDMRQYTVKILLNSIYGYLGSPVTRFYDRRIAEGVTLTGQEILKFSIEKIKELNNIQVITGDTDSCVLNVSKLCNTKEQCIEKGNELRKYVNNKLDELAKEKFNTTEHYLSFKFEKVCRRFLAVSKKHYAYWLIWEEGKDLDKIGFKGIEVVRSDTPEVCRDFMRQMLKLILEGNVKKTVDDYISCFTTTYRNMSIIEKAIPVGVHGIKKYTDSKTGMPIKGTGAHTKAAIFYNKLFQPQHSNLPKIQDNDKIRYFFVKNNRVDVIGFIDYVKELEEEYEIDVDRMIQRLITGKVEGIYECMNWTMSNSNEQFDEDLFV